MFVKINVRVACLKPSWIAHEGNRYRILVNGELLTERTWLWDLDYAVDEEIWVDVNPGTHTVTLVPVLKSLSPAKFVLQHLHINSTPVDDQGGDKLELSFTL